MISFQLFGGASLQRDGVTLTGPVAQRHRLALLSLLCVSHPRSLSRDKLLGYLWPERDGDHARNLLNQAVHVLRKALGDGVIVSTGDELRLDASRLECDVLAFREALAAGARDQADTLYTGPLLDGFFLSDAPEFERWVDQERDRLRRDWCTAVMELAEERSRTGEIVAARDWWQRLLADDPYDARATIGLMETLDAMGDRAGAIRQAQRHALLLETDLGAEPDPAVRAMLERLRAGGADATPARGHDRPVISNGPGEEEPAARAVDPGHAAGGTRTADVAPRNWRRVAAVAILLLVLGSVAWVSVHTRFGGRTDITSVAVLPLANLTGDPQEAYFVAGMHDALITELAQIKALTVLSRRSVLRYQDSDESVPDIAEELGVQAVVEGAVFKSGDSVRISVQLVRARPEEQLVSRTFTGPLDRALSLQGQVARAVAKAMRARVTPAVSARLAGGPTIDPAAQDAYLAGLYHLERGSYSQILPASERLVEFRLAIDKLEDAVARDSTWARAWAKLAFADHWLASSLPGQLEYFGRSREAALRAISLDSTESQAWASLGFVQLLHDWDWIGAERSIERAIELDPNSHHWIYAIYLEAAGRYDEAIDEFRKAEARDPLSDLLKAQIASAYSCAGRHDEAIAEARELRARVAATGRSGVIGDSAWILLFTSRENAMAGRSGEAIEEARQLVRLGDTASFGDALAFALAMGGRRAEAHALVDRMKALDVASPWWAGVYAALGDTARAIEVATAVVREREPLLTGARCWPVYQVLPDEPRLQALLEPVGFPR
jgi:DNA-binding SARP family transcriptional activator/TolB-like protein